VASFLCHLFGSFQDLFVDMMTTQAMKTMDSSDAELVTQSLAGIFAFRNNLRRHTLLLSTGRRWIDFDDV
jgi:hypothetical protein